MLRTTLEGLRARFSRMLLSAVAIVLGVAFVAGTFTFTETVKSAFFGRFAAQARHVDAAVRPPAPAREKTDPKLPFSLLPSVSQVAGAAAVEGRLSGPAPLLDGNGKLLADGDATGTAIDLPADPRFHAFTLTQGRLPQAAQEALLDKDSAQRGHFAIGDALTVLDSRQERRELRLVGLVDLGVNKQLAGGPALVLQPAVVRDVTGVRGYDRIDVAAAPGVSQPALAARIQQALPGRTVVTGTRLAHDLADGVLHQVDLFLTGLLVFGVVALLVAALVIYNTFKILIAQRTRELALLRCVGATRRQVFAGVVLESFAVGLLGSVAGVLAGIVLAAGVRSLVDWLGAGVPAGPVVVAPAGVGLALGVGIVMTVLAALLPAAMATRVAPVTALSVQMEGRVRLRFVRLLAGLLFAGAGITIAATGIPHGRNGLFTVVAGGCVFFLGVLAAGPLLAGLLAMPFARLPGVPARLAVAGARRNPGRTATTMVALTIGVGLMTLFSVVLATAGAFGSQQLQQHYPFDYLINGAGAGNSDDVVSPAVAAALRADSRIATAAELRTASVNGLRVAALDPSAYGAAYRPQLSAGSLERLPDGSVALYQPTARNLGVRVGSRLALDLPQGRSTFRVSAIFTDNLLGGEEAVLSWRDYLRGFGPGPDHAVLVLGRPGVAPAASRAAVDRAVAGQPLARVSSIAAYKSQLNSAINQMTALLGALLATAVLIALFGIANTLSLSVLERTRESALLRALGLTRRQLRGTLTIEALLIGLMGGVLGIAIGAGFGWAVSQAFLHDTGGGRVVFPLVRIAGYLAVAGLAGVAAALLPARRAARGSIIDGLADM